MSEQWVGLHNPERHDSWPSLIIRGCYTVECEPCKTSCTPDSLCRCCLAAEVERLTAALAESEAARTFAEGHSAALSKQLDRVNMLRIRALNGLREQTKVTIDQGVALADRDQKIAELAAEVERLERAEAAIARVRELHHSKLDRHPQGDVQRCIACLDLWPCSTIRAIDGGAE